MKKTMILWIGAMAVAGLLQTPLEAQEPSEVGRYQLFQGKYEHWDTDQGAKTEQSDMFLLDTVTGTASYYVSSVKNGKQMRYWQPAIFDENQPTFGVRS